VSSELPASARIPEAEDTTDKISKKGNQV